MAQYNLRLVVYEGEQFLDVLPQPLKIDASFPLNDTPALQFTYSGVDDVRGAELLDRLIPEQLDVALEVNWGNGWVEPRGGRFIVMNRGDDTADPTRAYEFIGVGVCEDLSGVTILDTSLFNNEGRLVFTEATPGQILDTYHNHGTAEGMLNFLTNDFTPSQTSAQDEVEPWNETITWEVERSASYRQILDALVAYGMINWTTEGNKLRVFNDSADGYPSEWGGMQRDLTNEADPVELVLGRECVDGPQRFDRRNLATDALILSDNNSSFVRSNSNAFIRRGRRIIAYNQGGIANSGAAAVIGDKLLQQAESTREELTRSLDFTVARWLPFRNYRPGDWVYGPGKTRQKIEKLRVAQITLTADQRGVASGSVVLHDRLLERSVAMQKQLTAIQAGAQIGTGGGGTKPAPKGRKPAKPGGGTTSPTVTGEAYIDASGHPRAVINISWPAVNSGVDGQAIDIDHYEVRIRRRRD